MLDTELQMQPTHRLDDCNSCNASAVEMVISDRTHLPGSTAVVAVMSCPLFQDYTDCRIGKRKERAEQQSSSTTASHCTPTRNHRMEEPQQRLGLGRTGVDLRADAARHQPLMRNFRLSLMEMEEQAPDEEFHKSVPLC